MKTHFLYEGMILQEMIAVNPNIRKMFTHTADTETIILLRGENAFASMQGGGGKKNVPKDVREG